MLEVCSGPCLFSIINAFNALGLSFRCVPWHSLSTGIWWDKCKVTTDNTWDLKHTHTHTLSHLFQGILCILCSNNAYFCVLGSNHPWHERRRKSFNTCPWYNIQVIQNIPTSSCVSVFLSRGNLSLFPRNILHMHMFMSASHPTLLSEHKWKNTIYAGISWCF